VILTVTLNAAIDRTVAVPNFRQGYRHRALESNSVPGGKGINVARALSLLGKPVVATGLAGGATGERLMGQLAEESILTDFTEIAAESRTNLAVIDPTSGEQTEINERGPEVTAEEIETFCTRLEYLAGGARICVVAGSLPPGAEPELYERIVASLRARDVLVVLDSEGEPLRCGTRARPSVVAPNVQEAEELAGHEFEDDPIDLANGLAELVDLGAEQAIVTRPQGCVATVGRNAERRFLEVSAETLDPVASVGSGDAFIAGYVAALYDKASEEESLRFAVACGAESTQHFGAGSVDPDRVKKLLAGVEVRELDVTATVA
jgi:1-phosphofructokinase/tagatose 6-phosphate kinase